MTVCLICFDVLDEGSFKNCNDHNICYECYGTYVTTIISEAITERVPKQIKCPEPTCGRLLSDDELIALGDQCDCQHLIEKHFTLWKADSVVCADCEHVFIPENNGKVQVCPSCEIEFCTVHGLDHQGRPCDTERINPWASFKNSVWMLRKTRKCRKCKNRIEKNGGCSHMTCRCGHEICWHCGGDYRKHGRSGHSRKLFPRPSDLKYTCNDHKMWSKRVGVVALAVPAVAIGIPLAVAGLVCVWAPMMTHKKIKESRNRRRFRRQLEARRTYQHSPASQIEQCQSYNHSVGLECLQCSGQTAHDHVHRYNQYEGFMICRECNHFSIPQGQCPHYVRDGYCVICLAAVSDARDDWTDDENTSVGSTTTYEELHDDIHDYHSHDQDVSIVPLHLSIFSRESLEYLEDFGVDLNEIFIPPAPPLPTPDWTRRHRYRTHTTQQRPRALRAPSSFYRHDRARPICRRSTPQSTLSPPPPAPPLPPSDWHIMRRNQVAYVPPPPPLPPTDWHKQHHLEQSCC